MPLEQREAADQPTTTPQTDAFVEIKPVETIPSDQLDNSFERTRTRQQLQPGQLLGQYRILKHLGSGGMGQVYQAIHTAMDRVVALKVIAPRFMQDATIRARFQREVRSAARLLHPNVVVAHDAAEVQGQWFLVMEYIDGKDVASLLYRHGRPALGLACEIIRQVAVGLQYAHELGMVHRDIKPANLIVTRARSSPSDPAMMDAWPTPPLVKILDFGLARLVTPDGEIVGSEAVTREGCVLGTPEYMAPEQARDSRHVDIRGDIYSLGCTFYSLLAGRPPFRALNSFELIILHLQEPADPIARYCPDVPVELSALVHRMLAKRPEDRFQTPGEVAAALQSLSRLIAGSSPQPSVLVPSQSIAYLQSVASPGIADAPVSPPQAAPLPGHPPKPAVPPEVVAMHFQAILRTIMLMLIIIFVIVGSAMYLPDIGDYALRLWHKITPPTTRTFTPPRR